MSRPAGVRMDRRNFLKRAALFSVALPRFSIGQPGPPANSKLNVPLFAIIVESPA
jgi:hypothetical protein